MNYNVTEKETKKYIEFISAESELNSERDALDLVALCGENDTGLLMIHGTALSDDFFKLRTGVAGMIIQKLVNYQIKTAVILPDQTITKGKFREMVSESNKGNHFRVFENREDAEGWLLS